MSTPTNEQLEGMLMAQRQVLSQLIAAIIGDGRSAAAWGRRFLDNDFSVQDGQEDPGAVPDPAFASQAAVVEELTLIAREASRILESQKKTVKQP